MALNCGIIGLPNVGKSTIFNALVGGRALVANYPFSTVEPNVGVAVIPDERLAKLTQIFKSRKTTPTAIEFRDIAGLVEGSSLGEGLGNQFLNQVREADALVHVVRVFEHPDVIHVAGAMDPERDIGRVEELARARGARAVTICGAVEAEVAALPPQERADYFRELGMGEGGLVRLVRTAYELLNLITFFTAGEVESRAWTIRRGTKAAQAAGKVHSDMERGFIRAEVYHYDDLIACGSEAGVREKGLFRLEGRDYVVKDGDVLFFRFNV